MFKISKVSVLPTQAGNGLKIKDFEIGCARIVGIESDGEEFDKTVEDAGLTLGFTMPHIDGTKPEPEEKPVLFFEDSIENAKNYVLVKIDSNNEVSVINSAQDICDMFDLPEEDVKTLNLYMGALASDRQLKLNVVKDTDGEDVMFFTNLIDVEIMREYHDGELEIATAKYLNIMGSPDYRAEYFSDNFIKMFLISIITACQDRYNKVHRDDVLREVASILSSITYWHDGQLYKPSILDMENYINDIKGTIRVE